MVLRKICWIISQTIYCIFIFITQTYRHTEKYWPSMCDWTPWNLGKPKTKAMFFWRLLQKQHYAKFIIVPHRKRPTSPMLSHQPQARTEERVRLRFLQCLQRQRPMARGEAKRWAKELRPWQTFFWRRSRRSRALDIPSGSGSWTK